MKNDNSGSKVSCSKGIIVAASLSFAALGYFGGYYHASSNTVPQKESEVEKECSNRPIIERNLIYQSSLPRQEKFSEVEGKPASQCYECIDYFLQNTSSQENSGSKNSDDKDLILNTYDLGFKEISIRKGEKPDASVYRKTLDNLITGDLSVWCETDSYQFLREYATMKDPIGNVVEDEGFKTMSAFRARLADYMENKECDY